MQFSGGATVVNTTIGWTSNWLGIQTGYVVDQEGLTADVSCQAADASSQALNLTNLNITIPIHLPGNTSLAYTLIAWNSTANCSASSSIASQQYSTWADASGQPAALATGFLPAVICPGYMDPSVGCGRFAIATQGFYFRRGPVRLPCLIPPRVSTTQTVAPAPSQHRELSWTDLARRLQ
ncbi:hypothetical protein PAXRUDRAFT_214458 [Paxillus rubicundulus Ve08.2h10]|uniref:Uncharacterized protein n=1 Tax=Paxillus rubicundulus Ve08.2h10 TaxID=930991 RepID=A0A0D0DTY5_9AGAM|nr:hypothetical protein PAXRUDRAFT_214458 [Paxillus rubicundulus Ve08.2h10]